MYVEGFKKLYWGFLFVMIDFRIQGFSILPGIVGFIFFFVGLGMLASNSEYFGKARNFATPMIALSVFTIYQRPHHDIGSQVGALWPLGILLMIASLVLTLLTVYNIFMGIKDMAQQQEEMDLYHEAEGKWKQYLGLQIALIFTFVLMVAPALLFMYAIVLFIATITIAVGIMKFMKKCGENL
ncbi:MAG: hypothetical protein JJT76_06175 [Clostridiaceae bacterium]|nr:hypothetical protein [Clostridiaceae bacterium]